VVGTQFKALDGTIVSSFLVDAVEVLGFLQGLLLSFSSSSSVLVACDDGDCGCGCGCPARALIKLRAPQVPTNTLEEFITSVCIVLYCAVLFAGFEVMQCTVFQVVLERWCDTVGNAVNFLVLCCG